MFRSHSFLYPAHRHDYNRPFRFGVTRDPEASSQLEKALFEKGYEFGFSILNFPPNERQDRLLPVEALYPVDLHFVKPGDILFQSTRPPASDLHHADVRQIEASNSNVERAIFNHVWRYFETVSRSFVKLREEAAQALVDGMKDRAEMTFHQRRGCNYRYLQQPGRSRSRRTPAGQNTAGFILSVAEIWPGGPGYLGCWGQDAITTLGLCRSLRFRYPELLDNRGLTMVEIEPTPTPERPSTYAWTEDWKVDVILETKGEFPRRDDEEDVPIAW